MTQQKSPPEIIFPVDWQFRIVVVAETAAATREILGKVLKDHGVLNPLTDGAVSSGGKYRTFLVSVLLTGREMMNQLAQELADVPGVKIVL